MSPETVVVLAHVAVVAAGVAVGLAAYEALKP